MPREVTLLKLTDALGRPRLVNAASIEKVELRDGITQVCLEHWQPFSVQESPTTILYLLHQEQEAWASRHKRTT